MIKDKLVIGSDHAGFKLKEIIKSYLKELGYDVKDIGVYNDEESADYPVIAKQAAHLVASDKFSKGILICGSGIGMSITANKVKGIRCAHLTDCFSAEATRLHNDANMMALGARVTGTGLALKIVKTFLSTDYSGSERHTRRINKMMSIENK